MKMPRFAEKLSAALRRGKSAPASENSAASAKATPAPRSGASLPARAARRALRLRHIRGLLPLRGLRVGADVRLARR